MIKFDVNSGDLFNRLQVLAKAQASKASISILEYVKIEVADNAIMLTAGDTDNTIQTCLGVNVIEGRGEAICIRTDNLLIGLKELPNQPITIIANEKGAMDIRIDYHNGHFSLLGQSSDDYPSPIGLADDARRFFLNGEKLRSGVTACKKFVADDELRPVMCGIYFDLTTAHKLTMVASDGHALVRDTYDIGNDIEPISFNLPFKASSLLTNMIGKTDDDVEIGVDNNRAIFKTIDYTMTCRLIEGKYPNYNSVIPEDNPIVVNLQKETLSSCLRRVLVSATKNISLVSMQISKGAILLSARDDGYGTVTEETISCEYEGKDFSIGFKGTLFLDILSVIPSETIAMKMSAPERAVLVVPLENNDGEDLTTLCMPLLNI